MLVVDKTLKNNKNNMPISNKDLGKYKRPGIFIEEIDISFIERPIQEVLINLVPGFSKKGPFNKPVRVDNPTDFETIFGPVDKNLENRGSFFHRFVEDMLNTGPVWALNLLKTDPTRDQLEWQSISVAAQYDNGPKNSSPYERFFNRQDFWERDAESFMDIIDQEFIDNPYSSVNITGQPNPAHDLFSITNMGDKKITLFTFKSSITGFDVSAESWYGGVDKVPLFMNSKDYISDYMISVLSIVGDYTDYATLSVDPYWGAYFNANGLIKANIQNFVSDRLTTINAYYDVCLIPNFRDINGRDLYIKTVINAATETTGLFCYYNEEYLLNSDFYKGNIDTIGATLVVTEDVLNNVVAKTSIDFMSYKTSLSEKIGYSEKSLDYTSNPFGNHSQNLTSDFGGVLSRSGEFTNWYTNIKPSASAVTGTTSLIASIANSAITLTSASGLVVGDIIYFNKSFGILDKSLPYYILTINTNDISISKTKNGPALIGMTSAVNTFVYTLKQSYVISAGFTGLTYNINGTKYELLDSSLYFEPFVVNNSAQTYSRYDIVYLNSDISTLHTVKGNQVSGTSPSKPNFLLSNSNSIILGYVKIVYTLESSTTPTFTYVYNGITTDTTGYLPLANGVDVSAITGVTTAGIKYLDLYFLGTSGSTDYTNYQKLRKSKIFTELYTNFLTGKSVMINGVDGTKYPVTATIFESTTTDNAHIMIYFDSLTATNPNEYYIAGAFLFYYVDFELDFYLKDNSLSNIITTDLPYTGLSNTTGIVAKYSTLYQDYYNGIINNGDYIYFNNDETQYKIYLKMYLDADKNLDIKFASSPEGDPDTTLSNVSVNYLDSDGNISLVVYSNKSSYKQTLEIENTSYITDFNNVNYVYVDKTRYSEVTKGWYMEAYYDTSYYDSPGEGYILGAVPRKLVRVTKTAIDSTNPSLKILYTDGPIRISSNSGGTGYDYYTTAYMTIDNYVTEYNGITLKPFVVHPDSMPNGTDLRLNSILSVIDSTTNLAKGLANKNRITWRYLIDSFGLGLTQNSKQEFVDLCGMKLNCFGFISMPSARQFKTNINPSFINDDRTINTEYIKEGGNPDLNPSYLYSFGDGVGRSCVGYFFPYVKDPNDTTKFIPPAAKIAKAYMKKFTGGLPNAYPWQIVAGPQFSLLTDVASTEMRFTNEDLENFYSMGANPIVYTLNRGFNINSENTAQVYPLSSLSYIHSREVLIELENRLYDMLLNYHWRFNTPEIRAEIKFRADQICKELLNANALYDFKNVCDKTNNTDYIIDLQMGVLDTYIEIIKGMGIIVNNITILKKGTIASGGFLPA